MKSELTVFIHPLFLFRHSHTRCHGNLLLTASYYAQVMRKGTRVSPEKSSLWLLKPHSNFEFWFTEALGASSAANGASGNCLVSKSLGDQQTQHALGTQSTHWTAFKYTQPRDTLAILSRVTLSVAQSPSSLLNLAPLGAQERSIWAHTHTYIYLDP